MKKVLLLAGAMLALTVGVASAQGINFNWDDCTLGAPASNKTTACNSNFGAPNKLIISLDPGAATIDNINGAQGIVDIQVAGGSLPDYWRVDPGACRAGALAADVNVGSSNAPFSCPEPWASAGGGQAGGAQLAPFIGGADRARITWIVAIPGLTAFDPGIAPDWYVIALNLTNSKTTGTGACAGCATPACLVANEIRLTRPAQDVRGDVFVYGPALGQHVTWQGGDPTIPCPQGTPTQSNTWGQLKSLYR